MNDQTDSAPAPQEEPAAEPAAADAAPAREPRRRPSKGQLLVGAGALVTVLAVGTAGFAVGRTTADEGGRPDRPGHGQGFDQRGPGMMPPGGMPGGVPGGRPARPDDPSQDDEQAPSTGESDDS